MTSHPDDLGKSKRTDQDYLSNQHLNRLSDLYLAATDEHAAGLRR